jgi:endonuclease/exonuclease/phosphatase family metal-dependent hydrolase
MGSTSGESLLVASYNIRRGIGFDEKRDTQRVARVIEEISPDLIALQEVDSALDDDSAPGQLDDLQDHLRLKRVSGVTLRREDAAYGNALLSRLPVRDVRRHDISVEGREPRGVIDAEVEFHGTTVRVLATHLGLRAAERREQIARVSSFLDARDDLPTLLVGDFNDWRIGWGPLAALARRFGGWSGPRTFPSRWPLFKLDRIWAHPGDWNVDRLWTHRSRSALRASDHLPVCARVRLRSNPGPRTLGSPLGQNGSHCSRRRAPSKLSLWLASSRRCSMPSG